jgi:inorganic phosphate transporter, PiT family
MLFGIPTLVLLVIVFALAFDYINGFHDTANAIATVVSTRTLTPRTAILMAAVLNFVGALSTQGVAKTVAAGIVDANAEPTGIPQTLILAGVGGAIVWNLITWYYGIPSSSSHALMGGLCGAALVHGGMKMILWDGVTTKVLIPIVLSPLIAFTIGFLVMTLINIIFFNSQPQTVNRGFRSLQVCSSAMMAFSHGSNDAQKSMGVITMALISTGLLVPTDPSSPSIPSWVVLSCAVAMALGTSVGGWRIIKTMGHKIMKLEPVSGFAADTSSSIVILMADHFHAPISTTQVISGSIFGVGSAKRLSAVRWSVARNMVVAWILTLPASASVAGILYLTFRAAGLE